MTYMVVAQHNPSTYFCTDNYVEAENTWEAANAKGLPALLYAIRYRPEDYQRIMEERKAYGGYKRGGL